ncbi:DUF6083 domain-containing protein [Streptomyces chrestomyceticus]|uniref:DUF6083 domain-containing protein n=1 Tax=Streptomyces chrestomyceticus TaxID=68185 RepID=UPI003689DE7A
MRSSPPGGRHWDGSPRHTARPRRWLRVAVDSPSRLLRSAQCDRCRHCGNPIEWCYLANGSPVPLHPAELPCAVVPADERWHLSSGIAHPAGDGSAWCRIAHQSLCPARTAPPDPTPQLRDLRRRLALRTRHLKDAGALPPPSAEPAPPTVPCRPARPVVRLLYVRYLAPCPVEDLRCVAQTRTRHRCTHPLLAPDTPPGTWTLLPTTPATGQLPLPDTRMAVYDLTGLPYGEQLRWRTQRCPVHAAAPAAADTACTQWEPFDPLLHHQHIHPRLPTSARHHRARP